MSPRARIEVVLNANAGGSARCDRTEELQRHFARHGVRANITVSGAGEALHRAARVALDRAPDVVVAGGGDGTLSAVADIVAGSGVPLGVLPLGTLNHFAKDAGIPLDLATAVETVCIGDVIAVDVGRVNGRVFLNNSSLGLYPEAVRTRDALRERLRHGRWPASLWAAVRVLRRYPFFDVRIRTERELLHRRTPLVFIGNNRYALEGPRIGKRDRLDAGYLTVHIIDRTDRFGLLVLAMQALLGRLRHAPNFETLRATRVELDTRRKRATVATDGEIERLAMPLWFESDPRALSLVAPRRVTAPA